MGNIEVTENWLWLATDSNGHVAAFQTFGSGVLPPALRNNGELAEMLDTFLEEGNWRNCRCRVHLEERYKCLEHDANEGSFFNGASELAQSGFFYYVPSHSERFAYDRVASPSKPLTVSEMPLDLQIALRRLKVAAINFANATELVESDVSSINNAI